MNSIRIEVVEAGPAGERVDELRLPPGSTVADAIAGRRLPGGGKVGIYGRVVAVDTRLADGDRVEIYRPLALDPKEARRRRARRRR